MSGIRLVVQADDFGMCHAVNEGIVAAFNDGIVTQASVMAACPWFSEAAALARIHSIPCGVHLTLTCEWDNLRWGPITGGTSLTGDDGTFRRTVPEARDAADHDEAVAELASQVERFLGAGLQPTHFDPHMGLVATTAYEEMCRRFDGRFIYPVMDRAFRFETMKMLSERDADGKSAWLVDHLEGLKPGTHFLCTHPGVTGPELSSITSPSSVPFRWAEEYRVSDLEALCAPEVRDVVERRGIELTSVAAL